MDLGDVNPGGAAGDPDAKPHRPTDGESSPEKTKAEMKVLSLCDVRVSAMDRSTTALLDSGATHCLRNAHDREEWLQSEEVLVQQAGNNALTMRLSSGGSLLMPPRSPTTSTTTSATQGQTTVPLGELVKTLGYSLDWSQRGCFLVDPNGISRSLGVSGGCPLMQEAEALALISRLEDRKREMLENAIVSTQDAVEASEMMMVRSWKTYLEEYVATGGMEAGLRAVRDSPMLSELPGECVSGLAQANVIKDGWKVFKDIEYLSRPQRRRLWTAKRWVIHLYAGCPGHFQIYQLDEGDTVVVELDVQRNRGHDVTRSSTWRLLMWAAMQGKIEAIIGGPPGRTSLGCLNKGSEEWDNKSLKAVARMLWLHAVAVEGRTLNAKGSDRGRPVAFMMEHPSMNKEAEFLGQKSRRKSVWETAMWRVFQEEYDMIEVTFDQKATGAKGSLPTTLGTNVYHLQGLQGEGMDTAVCEDTKDYSGAWSSGLTKAIVMALSFWKRSPMTIPRLCPMTPAQWKRHVDSNHLDYNRERLTCVLARGTGRRHARVHHPEMFSLTVDIAGPVKPGLDCTSKGAQGRPLYGLREVPMLWSAYRDRTLAGLVSLSGWRFRQGRTVTCWWVVKDEVGGAKAVIVIYVDDILIIGMEDAVREIATLVQGLWATSPLTFLRRDTPLRFLGMELSLAEDETTILVGQQAYIEELGRNHGVNIQGSRKLQCPGHRRGAG